MNTINPKSIKIVKGLPPVLTKSDRCAIDTEWFGMDKDRLHRPHGTFAVATFCSDGETVYAVTDIDDLKQAFENVDPAVHIYVNAKFDIIQLRKYIHLPIRKRLWDCFLIEQIMYSGLYNDFSLADMARRRLGIYLPKDVRSEFSGATEMTKEMLEYSCIDTVATWKVYQSQRAEIDDNDLTIWKEIELPFLWTILAMGGVRLNAGAWVELAKRNKEIADNIQARYGYMHEVDSPIRVRSKKKDDYVGEVIPSKKKLEFVGINLNSPKQVKEHFISMGYKKIKSTDASAMEELINNGLVSSEIKEFAKDLLEYRTYAKRASTYGEKFIEQYVESDGKIYGDIFQMGAETGRTSSRHPNLQNQPALPEYRDCFIADEGNVIIVADYGSQEPRFAAHFSQDARLIEILNSGKKLYIEIAHDVFHKEITKQDVEYGHVKSTILGIFYGMSAFGLSARLGVTEDEAQEMIDKILETYPGIQDYIDQQSQADDYVQSVCGRKVWLNKYDKGWIRGALNYPIQGSAADATKKAAYHFLLKWFYEMGDYESIEQVSFYDESPLRLLVHDEIVVEVPEALRDTAKRILKEAMVEVANEMHDQIKGVAEVFHGNSWACKH